MGGVCVGDGVKVGIGTRLCRRWSFVGGWGKVVIWERRIGKVCIGGGSILEGGHISDGG